MNKVAVQQGDSVQFMYKGELRYGDVESINRFAQTITLKDVARGNAFRQFTLCKVRDFNFWGAKGSIPTHQLFVA